MADNIFFIESIYSPIGDYLSYVTFLPAEVNSERSPMVVAMNRNQMGVNGHRGDMKEGWYVIYDREAQGNPFTYGNRTSLARKQYKDFRSIQQQLLQNNVTEESQNSRALLEQLSIDDNAQITSYHVNVGHGNCSVVLIQYDGNHQIWMVDGSLSEKGNGNQFAMNLEACFDEIRKRLGVPDEPIKLKRFFLTHPHTDHFSGVEYLVTNGHIDRDTICYWNLYYHWSYAKAVLMGRDGAYNGIYSPVVTSYWSGRGTLVKTEDAQHCVELDWGSGNEKYL